MKRRRLLGLGLVALYVACYPLLRVTHVIVHRQGYAGGDHVGTHFVEGGDYAPTTPVRALTLWALEVGYTPLRMLELGGWYVVRPPGQAWPDRPRDR